jgi:SAM-dependent methyltransferase
MDHHDHHSGTHHHSGAEADSGDALAELLELDAEVLHGYLSGAIAWVAGQAPDRPRHRIVDLGSGTGTASIALAQRFTGAEVLAVDASAEMLARVQVKVVDLGLDGRVGTLEADLDGPWPATVMPVRFPRTAPRRTRAARRGRTPGAGCPVAGAGARRTPR